MTFTVHHIGVAARDVERSLAFYVRLLSGVTRAAAGHTLVEAGDVRVAIVPRRDDDPPAYAHGAHLALCAPESERAAILARLDELGAARQDVGARVYTRDPDGFVVELLFE